MGVQRYTILQMTFRGKVRYIQQRKCSWPQEEYQRISKVDVKLMLCDIKPFIVVVVFFKSLCL